MFQKKIGISVALIITFLVMSTTGCSTSKTTTQDTKTETIKVGLSVPLSGSAASWGITTEWVAKQAAKDINEKGGVHADGKVYKFDVVAYDNKYNAAEGAKVAQTLINKDGVKFLVASVGSAPVLALQSVSEPAKVIHFTTAWSKSAKGPNYPYTFSCINSPIEIMGPMFKAIMQKHPDKKAVTILNPSDATGKDAMRVAVTEWDKLGVKVLAQEFYERGTNDFSQIVTKILQKQPDIVDLGAAPPSDAGLIFKSLAEHGWKGVKIVGTGTSAEELVSAAGDAANDVYLGLAPDFNSASATAVQKDLEQKAEKETGYHLSTIAMSAWDSMMAIKSGIEKADTLNSEKLKEVIRTNTFDSSYGPSRFVGEKEYGTNQQMLLPITVTQIQNGKPVEVTRVNP